MKARRSKEDWQELILRQTKSGLSAQQFCRDNDVCPKYFSIRKKIRIASVSFRTRFTI